MRAGDIDENHAIWLADQAPYQPSPALVGTISADVAVVGGGFTGMSTAWHLARRFPGRRVVLLEARVLANGASGRNGGQVLNWLAGVPTTEPELAQRIFNFTRDGIDFIERVAREHAPAAVFSRNGCLEVCTSAAGAERAQAEVERLQGLDIPVRWLPATAVGLAGVHGAVLDPTAGQVNGLALLRGWKPALVAAGVEIHEATPVIRIGEERTVRLSTPGGEVRAHALVLATNAYTPSLGYFKDAILPLHSHVLATDVLSPETWQASGLAPYDGFSDDRDRIAYGCRSGSGRLVLGGGSNSAYAYLFGGEPVFRVAAGRSKRSVTALQSTLAHYFPGVAHSAPAACWTGLLDISFDRAASLGVTGQGGNVYYALGYSGHGVVLGMLAGRVLCDLYAGDHEPWRDFPFYQRRLPRIPREPLRWLGYQAYTRFTGRSPRRE